MDDDSLRAHYGRDASGHPDESTWEKLALGELDASVRSGIFDHAGRCTSCAHVLRGVLALEEEALKADPTRTPVLTRREKRGRGVFWLSFAAAAMVLAAVGLATLERTPLPMGETVRSLDSERPTPLGPVGNLAAPPREFSWEASGVRQRFVVELLDGLGETLWMSPETSASTLPWPDEIPPAPGRYYWRVLEIGEAGDSVASPVAAFDVADE